MAMIRLVILTTSHRMGKSDIKFTYKEVTYLFANTANATKFKAYPEKFEPAYGGWCAFAMGETGEKVKIDPETFKIIDGRLYLFYNFWGNNTLSDWNKNEKTYSNPKPTKTGKKSSNSITIHKPH
jgi:YHS domain-containing protein